MYRFSFLFILAFLISFTTKAQKTYKLVDLFIKAIEGKEFDQPFFQDTISIEGIDEMMGADLFTILSEKDFPKDSEGRIIINSPINLRQNLKEELIIFLQFYNFRFKEPVFIEFSNLEEQILWLDNCVFEDDVRISTNQDCEGCEVYIFNSQFFGDLELETKSIDVTSNQFMSRIKSRKVNRTQYYYWYQIDSLSFKSKKWGRNILSYDKRVTIDASDIVRFRENNLYAEQMQVRLRANSNEVYIADNKIKGILDLSSAIVSTRLTLVNNLLDGNLDVSQTVFPEVYRKVRWNDSSNIELAVGTRTTFDYIGDLPENFSKASIKEVNGDTTVLSNYLYYLGLTTEEVRSDLIYDLKSSYQKLSDIYKENSDQEAANWAYAQKMTLEGKRLGEEYKDDKNFRTFFRWQLNNLMRIYTNHGTDPGLAITISLYVVLFFAVIYFFFPSEWDVSSKSKLLSDFKDFTAKNDKGYFFPFLNVVGGLTISLINALTLSLNSFTTLGFGNIPTKGLARYLTIIQGFVGWFLLGLFSVSLINQVLA